jgi:ZIP family zinc transporter
LDFLDTLLLSSVIGLSIYLSLPLILTGGSSQSRTKLLNAVAIGILIFLIGDVFLDAAQSLYGTALYGYGSSPMYDAVFASSMSLGFLALLLIGHRKKGMTPTQLTLLIAIGIGFQNLTEGLLFGSLGVTIGLTGATTVVLVGFVLQNITEGFPITSPLAGSFAANGRPLGLISLALMIGGLPTILGGAVGFYFNTTVLDLTFFGLAVGTMLYVILPMMRNLLKDADSRKLGLAYGGVFLGFVLGFVVNLL